MEKWIILIMEKLEHWRDSFFRMLPNLALALLIVVVAYILSRTVRRLFQKAMLRISGKTSLSDLVSRVSQLVVFFIGLFIALDILQLNRAVSSLLAGAGIIGLILGFAFQDITSNFISGIYITLKKPFDIGHTIKTNEFMGSVEEIELRSTTLRTFDGLHLMIPNRDIIQKPIINYSLTNKRRIELDFFVDSDHELPTVHRAVVAAMQRLDYICDGKPVEIYFSDFRDNAVKMSVWFWIDNHAPPGYMVARHDAIFNIVDALKSKGISLMVPQTIQSIKNNS